MGGVDLLDRIIGKNTRSTTYKWTVQTIFHFVDFSVAAGWLELWEHRKFVEMDKDIMDYLHFKMSVAKTLVLKNEVPQVPIETVGSGNEEPKIRKRKIEIIFDKRYRYLGNVHLVESKYQSKSQDQNADIPNARN
ncbi:hypothetical protein HHI36_018078 [Cryptolaemus montrouzieri]|uniref:Uncharacterized protein n=1 Tax=Cryptolaemus montrouzieri TaxID=559131 RepID=A0ABD2NZ71_9CUCU